jgi:hypothetical protein
MPIISARLEVEVGGSQSMADKKPKTLSEN